MWRDSLIRRLSQGARLSWAQNGEDIIVVDLLKLIGIAKPFYLDIGANDPVHLSNTYYFYRQGCVGMCVEPNPLLVTRLKDKRPRDIVLQYAVGATHGEAQLLVNDDHALSTVSTDGQKGVTVEMLTLKEVIERCPRIPDVVSLDVEGMDLDILSAYDFSSRPAVWCVETISPKGRVDSAIREYMLSKNYAVHADTYINTIFVDARLLKKGGEV